MKHRDALAICKKTYPDEDDMQRFCDGEIEPCDVKINFKGGMYFVNPEFYNEEYFQLVGPPKTKN